MEPKTLGEEPKASPPIAIKLSNPRGLLLPEVQDLINLGLKPLFDQGLDPSEVWLELVRWVAAGANSCSAVFIGHENGKFLSFLLLEAPKPPFDPYPNVVFFQNLGSNSLRRAMIKQLVDHLQQTGHKTVSFHNGAKVPDSVYIRTLCKTGSAKATGSRILWRWGNDEGTIRRLGEHEQTS
jgi:hypothetical protein